VRLTIGLVYFHIGGFHHQPTPFRHGVPRVDDQIEKDLLDLSRVRLDPAQVLAQRGHELDVRGQEPVEHLLHVGDDLVEIENLGLQHLLPAEGQELPRQCRRALRSLGDLLQASVVGISWGHLLQDHLAVAADHSQQIVEIVRDATREAPDRFELLGLAKLVFEQLSLRDVMKRYDGSQTPPVHPEDRLSADEDHPRLSVAPTNQHLDIPDSLAAKRAVEWERLLLKQPLSIGMVEAVVLGPLLGWDGGFRQANDLAGGAIEHGQHAGGIARHDPGVQAVQHRVHEPLAVGRRLCGLESRLTDRDVLESATNRWPEARQALLQYIIRRPPTEALDGRLLTHRP